MDELGQMAFFHAVPLYKSIFLFLLLRLYDGCCIEQCIVIYVHADRIMQFAIYESLDVRLILGKRSDVLMRTMPGSTPSNFTISFRNDH